MKITKENISGLLDQFRIGAKCNITGVKKARLAEFLAEHLTPDTSIIEQREVLEREIGAALGQSILSKQSLKKLQEKCPHTDTEPIYSYDGMVLSKCNTCHKSLTTQGK